MPPSCLKTFGLPAPPVRPEGARRVAEGGAGREAGAALAMPVRRQGGPAGGEGKGEGRGARLQGASGRVQRAAGLRLGSDGSLSVSPSRPPADTQRALRLLEDYRAKLSPREDRQLRSSVERVIGIFRSSLFQALLGRRPPAALFPGGGRRGPGPPVGRGRPPFLPVAGPPLPGSPATAPLPGAPGVAWATARPWGVRVGWETSRERSFPFGLSAAAPGLETGGGQLEADGPLSLRSGKRRRIPSEEPLINLQIFKSSTR